MKLSKLSILTSALATSALAAPAVVTVTEHAHEAAVITVQGVVYVENGQTRTTYETLAPASTATPTSTATALVAPPVALSSASSNSDAVLSALKNLASVWGKTTDSTTTLTSSESTSQSLAQATRLLHPLLLPPLPHQLPPPPLLKPLLLAQHRLRIVTCQILPLLCWLNTTRRELCTRTHQLCPGPILWPPTLKTMLTTMIAPAL
ncbi:CBM_collapsed_G0031160.mRNA.1.CDS.1 [Saccharomyces cerevisiae]|nr:CBM_collapsed_G0031160.mRNA.1.CDS.1 [Saccharomyces cerevisiae]